MTFNYDFKDYKDLCKFIKECSKLGVTEFKSDTISFQLSGQTEWEHRLPRSKKIPAKVQRAADAIEAEGKKTLQNYELEEERALLAVENFEEFEALAIKELKGDGSDQEG